MRISFALVLLFLVSLKVEWTILSVSMALVDFPNLRLQGEREVAVGGKGFRLSDHVHDTEKMGSARGLADCLHLIQSTPKGSS